MIATGTKPARPAGVEFDEDRVLDSDGILDLKSLPSSMVVVGAGVIGIEYASMFAALGTKVTVVEKRDSMLDFCDPEVVEALKFHLRDLAVTFRFGEEVTAVDVGAAGTVTTLASGKQIPAETVMYSAGRQGQTEHLDAENAGLEIDSRGRIFVDDQFQTKVDHIYAVGDVIGFPALAATSMDQGRLAAYHAFGEPAKGMTELQPIGIYSIPEVSYVGATEVDLTRDSIPYEVGVSRYRELARGQIAGDSYGMLKLLVSTEDLQAARRAHLRHQRHRVGAHRPGRDGLRRHRRIPRGRGLQLPDVLGGLQGRGAGRDEQAARAQPVPLLGVSSRRRTPQAPRRRDRPPRRASAARRLRRRMAVSTRRFRRIRRRRAHRPDPVMVGPVVHGAPLVPSISPPHGSDGKPPGASSVAACSRSDRLRRPARIRSR